MLKSEYYIFISCAENGISMFIWIGLQASPEVLQQLFHANTIGQVDIEMVGSYCSHFLFNAISQLSIFDALVGQKRSSCVN